MKYFKNAEIVRLFNVSDKTVRNWISQSLDKRNTLDLVTQGDKTYVANSLHNTGLLENLADNSRKYRNQTAHKIVHPLPDLYEVYDDGQIISMINSLEKHGELPFHYRYMGKGAYYWAKYLDKLSESKVENIMSATNELLSLNTDYINKIISPYSYVNIVDLGTGNGLGARNFIRLILETGKLNAYIGIDESTELLEATRSNIKKWFANKIRTETHVMNIEYQRFNEILMRNTANGHDTINIILLLGATIGNFRNPTFLLNNIVSSMSRDDLLVISEKLDSVRARRFFDFHSDPVSKELPPHNTHVLDMLGLDKTLYTVEQYYDQRINERLVQLRFKLAITIAFQSGQFQKNVRFEKGDTMLLLRMTHWTEGEYQKLLSDNSLKQLSTTLTANSEYMLSISRTINSKN